MPKSRNRKDHKKKVANRNLKIKNDKKRVEKAQREFIMDLIKKEQANGAFENTPDISIVGGPDVDGTPTIDGPSI
jgi:hypothetical protein